MNKFVEPRPYADPEAAARKIVELADAHEPYMDGRILIEQLNGAMLYQHKATPAEYKAGLNRAIERGWLELHESGTFVRFTQSGKDLFALERPRTRRAAREDGPQASPVRRLGSFHWIRNSGDERLSSQPVPACGVAPCSAHHR